MEIPLEVHDEVEQPARRQQMERTGGPKLEQWRAELDSYYMSMLEFNELEPDDIFRNLSAWTARVSFIRGQIVRSESKVWAAFRTKEIDFFLQECDRQFKLWSRVFSVSSLDWQLAGRGQT